jgi:proline dehydrogenase
VDWERWVCKDLDAAINETRARNGAGIKVVLDPLSSYARNDAGLEASMHEHIRCIREISDQKVEASVAVKLSSLGMSFDRETCRSALRALAEEASSRAIILEMDMEGRTSVDFAISCALMLAEMGTPPTLAIQAYLDRSPADIMELQDKGIRIRLVKGAYQGDEVDPAMIRQRMLDDIDQLNASGKKYCLGTHDLVLIDKVQMNSSLQGIVQFGLLKGLGGDNIRSLASKGWDVEEYIPFGPNFQAYVHRREVYLKGLNSLGIKRSLDRSRI